MEVSACVSLLEEHPPSQEREGVPPKFHVLKKHSPSNMQDHYVNIRKLHDHSF